MMPARFRKRPVEIEAVQLTRENIAEVCAWVGGDASLFDVEEPYICVSTLEGTMRAFLGDWVIRGVAGEFYPCRDDIFRQTYEGL